MGCWIIKQCILNLVIKICVVLQSFHMKTMEILYFASSCVLSVVRISRYKIRNIERSYKVQKDIPKVLDIHIHIYIIMGSAPQRIKVRWCKLRHVGCILFFSVIKSFAVDEPNYDQAMTYILHLSFSLCVCVVWNYIWIFSMTIPKIALTDVMILSKY